MADKRISQLIERTDIANNDVLPIVASGATTTNKVTISTIQEWMQDNLDVGVTSVGITLGSSGTDVNVTGSPITTSGNITINIPTASATNRGLLSSSDWSSFNNKLSSVGLTMPSAFTVSNSPLTANGTIAVTGAGTVAQYIRGDGSLADFPEAGGGGASVSYYLNGSVSQGTIGGIAYREMNKTPILGAGTDFVALADGYLASFITDAGDPSLLLIPGGNWTFETYFSASSGGGTPSFYIELYKVDSGGTATLIASNSAVPELIAFGTTITPYFSTLAVPTTVLTLTDRLALRYYVARSGRTITLHTENSHLCQIITTFTTGLTALNGLTAQVQNFATGTSGTDFNISSSSATHTFNLPDASASNRGVVTTGTQTFAGYKIFTGTIGVNQDIQLATQGTALNTFIKNINATGLTSIGSNGFGFNNANNIYFSGSSKGGGVFAFSNTGTQTYTLQDASGTLAFTSDLGNYIQGVGTADSIPKFTGARTIANSAIRDTTSTVVISKNVSVDNGASQAINLTPASGGTTNRIETTGTLPLAIITSGSSITLAAGGVTPQITLASTGAVTLTGALNGTSATMSGRVNVNGATDDASKAINVAGNGYSFFGGSVTGLTPNSTGISIGYNRSGANGEATIVYGAPAAGFNFEIASVTSGTITPRLTISSTGAATFSSSVTANSLLVERSASRNMLGISSISLPTSGAEEGVAVVKTNSNLWQMSLVGYAADSKGMRIYNTGGTGNTSLEVATGAGTAFIVNGSGNVGIGTASPSSRLEVSSSAFNVATFNSTFGQMAISFANSGTTFSQIGSGVSVCSTAAADDLGFGTAGLNKNIVFATGTGFTERMRITSLGFLKASNTGSYVFPTGNYHELRTNQVDQWSTIMSNSSSSPYVLNLRHSVASPNNADNWFIFCEDSTTARFRVASNGNVTNTNGSYGSISDAKLKENIEDATPKLDDLMKVKVRNYNLIGDDKKQIGVIAQELEEVFPAMIDESEDFEEVEVPQVDEEGNEILNEEGEVQTTKEKVSKGTTTKSVKYSVFVPMLIKAMQEQQEQIKSLTEQVEALKSQING